jgi:hypothetical protein
MKLDIGCGNKKLDPTAIGIDRLPGAADIVWDLDTFPWPLESNQFSQIYMSHIIEHLSDPIRAMSEVHRVAQNNAEVLVITPHFSSHNSYVDPTHKLHLAAASFQYFTGKPFPTFEGSSFRFDVTSLNLTFGGNAILDGMGKWLASRSLAWYERHAAWVFPALDIRCKLRVSK